VYELIGAQVIRSSRWFKADIDLNALPPSGLQEKGMHRLAAFPVRQEGGSRL